MITHYHLDHAGGVAQLASRMKIGTFADHGPNMENSDSTRTVYGVYEKVAEQTKRITLKPGDQIPFKGLPVRDLGLPGQIERPKSGRTKDRNL